MHLELRFDGGIKRGNPGGVPVFGYHASKIVKDELGSHIVDVTYGYGIVINAPFEMGTNNTAEYAGLLAGLVHLGSQAYLDKCTSLGIKGDSQLVIRQLMGFYEIRQPHLKKFADRIRAILTGKPHAYMHIPRRENQRADDLANMAWDKYQTSPYCLRMDVINYQEL